jgi:preprotein translocase subunit SecE
MLKNSKVYKFYDQVKQEALKVVWPQKSELISSVTMVLVVVMVFSLFFLALDYGIYSMIQFLLNIGK